MKNTQFRVDDVFGDVIGNDNSSQVYYILSQIEVSKTFCIKINFFKQRKEKYEASAPPASE